MKALLFAVLSLSVAVHAYKIERNPAERILAALEVARMQKSPEYAALQAELVVLKAEAPDLKKQIRVVNGQLTRACEATEVRKAERREFDPHVNRFPVKTKCEEIQELNSDSRVILARQELAELSISFEQNQARTQEVELELVKIGPTILTREEYDEIVRQNNF